MMEWTRDPRWRKAGASLLGLAVLASGAAFGPRVLVTMDVFTIERVEVTGTRFTEPYAVVRAAGLDQPANLFEEAEAWRAGVLELPMVSEVRIRRRPPATLTIEVREAEPVALVAGEGLTPVDATGRALELDLIGVVLDLPIVAGAAFEEGQLTENGLAALRLLMLVRSHDEALSDRVSQVEVWPRAIQVVFRGNGPDALLPLEVTPVHLTQLRLAYTDLAGKGELSRAGRIDVRFRDQVVVSFNRRPVS
jgi:hypothetical protein